MSATRQKNIDMKQIMNNIIRLLLSTIMVAKECLVSWHGAVSS